jgi:hypothetical protein
MQKRNSMNQKVIPDEANKNKQKWNVNKITSLRNTCQLFQFYVPASYLPVGFAS